MKIVIAGGTSQSDFLISTLKKNHTLKIINNNEEYASYLANIHQIPVIFGNPCKKYILDSAEIFDYQVLISLMDNDADNLALCQMAKEKYNIKKTVAVVENPKNVELFKSFGVSEVISSAYLASQHIAKISTLDALVNSFSLENGDISVTELEVKEECKVIGLSLSNIHLPSQVIIGCIFRDGSMIVPNGQSVILAHDKLILISPSKTQSTLVEIFSGV